MQQILVGVIIGLVVSVGTWVWRSDFFSEPQKIIILISLLFPPGAVAVILVISIYNKVMESNNTTPDSTNNRQTQDIAVLEESLRKIKELHLKGLFSDSELNEKTAELEKQIRSIEKGRVRQSFELKVKESKEYRALLTLRSSNVINGDEFDRKVKKLVDDKMTEAKEKSPRIIINTGDNGRLDKTILGILIVIILTIVFAAINS